MAQYAGWQAPLQGLLDGDRGNLVDGIDRLLRDHHERKGDDPEHADEFVSLDTSVYFLLARGAGMDIDLERFDEDLREYLLVPSE